MGHSPRAQVHPCEVQVHQDLPSGSLPGMYSLRKVYRHSCSQPTGAMRPALPHAQCLQENWCVDPMGVSPRWAWRADEEGRGSRQLSFHPKKWALPPHTSSWKGNQGKEQVTQGVQSTRLYPSPHRDNSPASLVSSSSRGAAHQIGAKTPKTAARAQPPSQLGTVNQ